jgi:hypothetical protein
LLECNRFRQLAEKTDAYLNTLSVPQSEFQDVKTETDDGDLLIEMIVGNEDAADEVKEEEIYYDYDEKEDAYDIDDELPLKITVPAAKETADPDNKPKKRVRKKREPRSQKAPESEEDDRNFYCCKCSTFSEQEQVILDHYSTIHGNDPVNSMRPNVKTKRVYKFDCKMCGTTCKTAYKVKLHQKQFQNTKQCTECGLFLPPQKFEARACLHTSFWLDSYYH